MKNVNFGVQTLLQGFHKFNDKTADAQFKLILLSNIKNIILISELELCKQ